MPNNRYLLALPLVLLLAACRQDMHDQPKFKALSGSSFFPDGRASRPLIDGTIARGKLRTDTRMFQGKEGDAFVTQIPVPVTKALLERGQQRFNIYCSPCHGRLGDGEGLVTQRGFKHPPSYHSDKMRNQPAGYFYDVITNGFGAMASYASRVPAEDRWAIVSYIRALQLSQNATIEDVPAAEREHLDRPAAPAAEAPKQEGHH
ncbi:MAG: cytochrome c [Bryobacteraceae bacterium]